MTVLVKYQHKTSNSEAWFYAKPDAFKKPIIIFVGLVLDSLKEKVRTNFIILRLLLFPIVK